MVVRSAADHLLVPELVARGATVDRSDDGSWLVTGSDPESVGDTARQLGVAIHELRSARESLEKIYSALTTDAAEYVGLDR